MNANVINKLQAEIEAMVEQAEQLVAIADTKGLDASQTKVLNALLGESGDDGTIAEKRAELVRAEQLEQRINEIIPTLRIGGNNGQAPKSTTKGPLILNKGDKLADHAGKFKGIPHALGHAVLFAAGRKRGIPSEVRNAMTEGSDNRGGFFVPLELGGDVVDLARARSVVMNAGATMTRMGRDQKMVIHVTEDPTYGVHAELEEITASDMKFDGVYIRAATIAARMELSRELVDDAGDDFIRKLERYIGNSLGAKLDHMAINGSTPLNHPQGILQNDEIPTTGSIGAIDPTDLAAAAVEIREANFEPNSILLAPSIHRAVLDTEIGDGVNSARGFLNLPPSLAGKQLLHSNNVPTGSVILGDFSQFDWVVRQDMEIAVDASGEMHRKHGVSIRVVCRVDFHVSNPAAFHILTGVTAS